MWMFCSLGHSEFCCSWRTSWRDVRGMEVATGVVSTVFTLCSFYRKGSPTERHCSVTDSNHHYVFIKPVCFSSAVALSSADRCEGRYSLSSAARLTSVMPFIGCRPASCGRDGSPTGWWGWWAPSHLWLVWSRWAPATVTGQTVHSLHLTVRNRSDNRLNLGYWWKLLSERMRSRSLMWSDFSQTVCGRWFQFFNEENVADF